MGTDELRFPTAGHAVLLTADWPWAGPEITGKYGMINGVVGFRYELLQITWNYSAFRGFSTNGCPEHDFRPKEIYQELDMWVENPDVYVSCSGGPGTIALPAHLLKPTNNFYLTRFWCWKDLPRANSGFAYNLAVPVWTWDGKGYE